MLKKCKGAGRAINFNGCGKKSENRRFGLCTDCYIRWLFNSTEGVDYRNKCTIYGSKKAKKEAVAKSRMLSKKEKIESMSIASLIDAVKLPFQKLIRIRDHRKMCICCNKPLPFNIGDYNAGHFKKAEIYSGLIFHPDNVHGQLIYCNKYLCGNESNYTLNLPNRIGKERFNKLIDLSLQYKSYKWNRHTLLAMLKHYKKELKLVESGIKDISDVDFSVGVVSD